MDTGNRVVKTWGMWLGAGKREVKVGKWEASVMLSIIKKYIKKKKGRLYAKNL